MKKQLLQKQKGIVLALLCFLCVTSINAQTLLYSNDFETVDGLNGSTIVGNGVFEASGDAAHGQVFHNNPTNSGAVRTNFLKLPETIFSDFQATGSQGLTVSFWVNKSNATDYYWSPMFGAYATAPGRDWGNKPAFTLMARSNGLVNFDYVNTIDNQNYGSNEFTSGNSTSWLDAGGWHFYTFTITPTTGIVYVDGVVKNQWTFTSGVDGLFHVASELKYVALGGYQAWGWGDRDPAFAYDKLKIYAGAVSACQIGSLIASDGLTAPVIIASTSSIAFEGTTSASFTVSGANLTNEITLTAPLGITLSTYSIPTNPTDSTVTVTYDGTTTVDGNIVLSDGTTTANVAVKSYDSNCFTPLYPSGNMLADPYCNSYIADGWGTRSINTDPTYVYCGSSSGYINGGVYQRDFGKNGNAQMQPNTNYRVKAMLYGISGTNGIGVYGWGGQGDMNHNVTNGSWQTVDFTFTSGATLGGNQGTFVGFDKCYVDNFEMYVVSADQLATQADKDALNARITTATSLLSSTPEGDALGQYTTANRTILQDLINSSTTLYNNSSALVVEVPNASWALASAMLTYQSSMNIATNLLANGDYFIKIGGMYVNDPGSSSIADGTSPKISNNGLQSQISITNGSQIFTIAKVSGSDRILAIDRYSFFNAATSRNLNESALYKDLWGGTGDDSWRTQNIYNNGTDYAIQSGGNAANNGMWYLRTENELATNGINRTPIPADYVFELVPVSTVFSQQVAAGRTAFNAATIGVAVGEYNAARYNAFQSALVTAEGITAGTATKDSLYAYGAALQLFVANANLINVIESSIAAMATIVGSTDSTTITVSAKGLSGAITLALSGTDSTLFSVSSDSLPLTADSVASTVITIKYSSTVVSLSHVATLTISSIGAADKVFALTGSSYIQADTWTAPALTGSTITTGTTYYMYNVGSNGYLTRGSNWSTQATVSAQPRLNASTSVIKWTATNTTGSMWTFLYNLAGANQTDWFVCATNTTNGEVFVDAWDVAGREPNRPWTVALADTTNKIYSIQVRSDYGGYNATQYLGSAAAAEGTYNTVKYNRVGGDSYTQWKFVSQADLDLYNARILLNKYMTYAKNKAMDASAYIATYNAGVTADINTAAASLLTALGRTDVTTSITNPSFETNDFTGWTNNGFAINSSTAPADLAWTKDGTYWTEKWTNSGSNLAASTLTQTVSGLSSGLYELVVSGHAVQQGGSNPLHTGAYITAGSQTTQVDAGQNDYSISNILVAGSTLTIGYSLVAPVACNWTGFDNFRLYYYGPSMVPSIGASKTQFSFNGGDEYVSDSLTVSGSNLSDVISITAPAGITVNPTSLPAGSDNAKVVVTFENSTTVSGNITFTSGTTTVNVAVTAAPGEVCYTPLYPTGNLITDSRCNFYLANGWGGKSINTDPAYVYCGSSSAYINGGSVDRALNGTNGNAQMLANTAYRVKAKVWKVSGDNVGIGVYGWSNGQPDIYHAVTTTGSWQDVDFTFTSGATLGGNQGIFFNSGTGYIDNWEMYQIPPVINVIESSIAAMATTVGTTDSTTITVSGNGLSGAITLALSGTDADLFSVSSASLPLTAADSVVSTVVTIKYSPTVVSLSHVATLTISSIGATDKVFALTGSSSAVSIGKNATTSWNALVVNGRLKVIGVDSYDVYSVHGIKVAQVTANSSSKTVALNQGVYVVKTDQGVQKVIVR